MDFETLAMAKPKIVDMTKYTTNGGDITGLDVSTAILALCTQSVYANGTVQKASVTFADNAFQRECSLKENLLLKSSQEMDGRIIDVYFPTVVSINRNTNRCANLNSRATLNVNAGLMTMEACIVFNTDGLDATISCKATQFA